MVKSLLLVRSDSIGQGRHGLVEVLRTMKVVCRSGKERLDFDVVGGLRSRGESAIDCLTGRRVLAWISNSR